MKVTTQKVNLFLLAGTLVLVNSCKKDNLNPHDYGIFSAQDANIAMMNGEIDSDTPQHWDNYIKAFPNTHTLIMKQCPGSKNDAANLKNGADGSKSKSDDSSPL